MKAPERRLRNGRGPRPVKRVDAPNPVAGYRPPKTLKSLLEDEPGLRVNSAPGQPRVPAGSPHGGEWTSGHGPAAPHGPVGPGLTSRSLFDPHEGAAWEHVRSVGRDADVFGHQGVTTARPEHLNTPDRLRFEHHVLTALRELEGHASPYFAPLRPGGANATYFKVGGGTGGSHVTDARVSVVTRPSGLAVRFDGPRGGVKAITLPPDAPAQAVRAAVRLAHRKRPTVAELEALEALRTRNAADPETDPPPLPKSVPSPFLPGDRR